MILLIRLVAHLLIISVAPFKFQYDSINSTLKNKGYTVIVKFKFQYDSINSECKSKEEKIYVDLNFNMILLIRGPNA